MVCASSMKLIMHEGMGCCEHARHTRAQTQKHSAQHARAAVGARRASDHTYKGVHNMRVILGCYLEYTYMHSIIGAHG